MSHRPAPCDALHPSAIYAAFTAGFSQGFRPRCRWGTQTRRGLGPGFGFYV